MSRRAAAAAAATLILAVAAGCGPISAPEGHEARVEIEASREVSVRMVVSRVFGPSQPEGGIAGPQVLLDGDTVWVDLPVDEVYDISELGRIFVEVMDADPLDVAVNLRVTIDGRPEYDFTRPLSEGLLRYVFVGHR